MSEPVPVSNLTATILTTCALAMAGADFDHAMRIASHAHRADDFDLRVALRFTTISAAVIVLRWRRAGFPHDSAPDADMLARVEIARELWLERERPTANADTEPPTP